MIVTLQNRLASAGFEGWNLIVLGVILVVIVLLAPEGLVSGSAPVPGCRSACSPA